MDNGTHFSGQKYLKTSMERGFQRHKDTNLGHPDNHSPSDGHKKAHQTLMELFWIGINGKNHAHVLCELLYFP